MFGCCRPLCCGSASATVLFLRPNGSLLRPAPSSFAAGVGNVARARLRCGMIAWVSGIYDEPELYELACAYRDIPAEVTALLAWCATYFTGTAGEAGTRVSSALELAAGPAEHARELARRGLRTTTLDLSPAMCAY